MGRINLVDKCCTFFKFLLLDWFTEIILPLTPPKSTNVDRQFGLEIKQAVHSYFFMALTLFAVYDAVIAYFCE